MSYINKWIRLLKDFAWWIVIFILGFLVGSGILTAKASVITQDILFASNLTNKNGVSYKEELKKIDDLVSKIGMNYIIIIQSYVTTDTQYLNTIEILLLDTDKPDLYVGSGNLSLFPSYYFVRVGGYDAYSFNGTNGLGKIGSLITALENGTYTKRYISSGMSTTLMDGTENGYYRTIYDSSYNIYNTFDVPILVNGKSIGVGEKIPYMKDSSSKQIYTENYRIDSKNIDRIEYTFKLENNNPIHEFNFSTTWYSTIARADLFSPPYLEYMQNNISYKLPLDQYRRSTLDEVVYYDTQINPFINIQELKFIVDFQNINNLNDGANSNVLIHFDSSLDFTRKIIYVNDAESSTQYYTEVDFSNKYGVYLIPKVIKAETEQEVYSNVLYHAKGIRIDVFSSTDTSVAPVQTKYDYNNIGGLWGNFNYLFRYNNKNQLLFFTNKDYLTDTEPTKIRYDTRYFVHSICDSEFKCTPVTNPNTGEEVNPKPPVDEESYNFNSVVQKIKDFINSLHATLDPIAEAIQYFFDNLPSMIKNFLIVIYSCFLLFGLYRVIRR